MIKRIWASVWMIILFSGAGCGSRGLDHTVADMMTEPIVFPEGMQTRILERDTVFANGWDESYKLVAYLNSTQCDGCRLKELLMWKHLLRQLDSTSAWDSVRCIFIFHPKDTAELFERLVLYDFDRLVWVDQDGCFEQANPRLPDDPLFHTFLLDTENRVVLVGSPVGRPKMWVLYKQMIAKLVENDGVLPAEDGSAPD